MKYLHLSTLTVVTLLALSGCGKSEESTLGDGSEGMGSNALLSYVPTETPYLLANLEESPEEAINNLWERTQPSLDALQVQLTNFRTEMESQSATTSADSDTRLAHAFLSELDGKLNPEGIESLGFDTNPEFAFYGLEAFPVMRVSLSDAQALRATIGNILANANIESSEQEYEGISFWRLTDPDEDEVPAGIYVSILENHLAIGVFPIMAESELLPLFLGVTMPENSDARGRLAKLNNTHEYTAFGSGILDLHRLADQFIRPDTIAARLMAESGEFDPASLTEECVTEIHQIIDNSPRMTMGTVEFSTSAIALQYRMETPPSLAKQLIGLVSDIPAADEMTDRILEFSFGMRLGPVRDFLREKVMAIVDQPYQCEHLQRLNESAVAFIEKLNEPVPPFVNNFRGVRVSLTEIMMNLDSIPENARGQLALHVDQPQMFVGMAQMFLPDLAELGMTPGSPPVRLPESLIQVPGIVAYAAMTDDAIGLAVGEAEEERLPEFLDKDPGPEGMFLSANYDFAAYYQYQTTLEERLKAGQEQGDDDDNAHAQALLEFSEASRDAMTEMMDRNHTTMRFTADGMVINNRVTFKER